MEAKARKQETEMRWKDLEDGRRKFKLRKCDKAGNEDVWGTETTIVSLPVDSAVMLITSDKVRIGWVVSLLREQARCRKYGELGYFTKDSTGDPRCVLWKGNRE